MENNQNCEVIEIDLRQMLLILWSRAWLIVLIGLLVAALALGYAVFFVEPTYCASVQLYVNNNYDSPGFSSSQLVAAQDLADTYMVILESRNVLDEVAAQTGLGYSTKQLEKMISAESVNKTEVFEVTVECENYKHAAKIANTIAKVLPDKISVVVYGSSVSVLDYAVEDSKAVGPNYSNYLIMGGLLGVVITAALVIVLEMLNTSICSEVYLSQEYSEIPLLAVIPGGENSKGGYKGYYEADQGRSIGKKTGGRK